jgi:hypothetical protein
MQFNIRCPHCNGATVSAITMLSDEKLKSALAQNLDIEVMHTRIKDSSLGEDHVWGLTQQQKDHLARQL